ncbi:Methyltransferase domain-containing protein [Trichlorobacter thiogenes]|uniref:Methyltransferase domain-containing protein n=1 Tax=Trichlorobacter thiogenes TaxID=115783 RepID=A0A1T4MMA7_9BACT|nr:methyltransferase domain-containing protein [Trichlorobacter thiogenes]SJZ67967.1 Methyltransferase domain-containing protein [Trichlorobacter thiogenes]
MPSLTEKWCQKKALLAYYLVHRSTINSLPSCNNIISKSLISSVNDVKDYLGISTDDFFNYAVEWSRQEEKLFTNKSNISSFYESWSGDYTKYNICANVLNQHYDTINFRIIDKYFAKSFDYSDTIIDFGCGTGTLSISFIIQELFKPNIIMLDVYNDVNKFVEFRINKHNIGTRSLFHEVTSFKKSHIASGLYCIDVLEHLENSSDIFINNIHPMLKINGLLYLKAPWRGQLTHIDEAANNFYLGGGRAFLLKKYRLVLRAGTSDIMCIFQKKSD